MVTKGILSVLLLVSFFTGPRTRFFPGEEIKPTHIPQKENVWVFLLAGQSNMAGRGWVEPRDTIPSDRILTINKDGDVILAKEPLHFYEPSMMGLGCGLSFGRALVGQIPDSISILLIPVAVGGSSVSQWLGDSIHKNVQLLTNFKAKVEIGLGYGQLKGILWHQGESDANPDNCSLYQSRLSELFGRFRQIAGNGQLPILIGELGDFSNNDLWQSINGQIHAYVVDDCCARVIGTSGFSHNGDGVHFDSKAQRMMGERFANEFVKMGCP
ncbi:MAG: sialate O-acetylesterase [Breznakibacter sp.]